jgi:hypothetical protein
MYSNVSVNYIEAVINFLITYSDDILETLIDFLE